MEVTYIYLDGPKEREQLVGHIHSVRQEIRAVVAVIPEDQWYIPRYHGWSLGAMMGHLNLMDNIWMLFVKASLLGINPSIPPSMIGSLNSFVSGIFSKRLVPVSLKSMDKNEQRIADLILNLPVSQFTKFVYSPQDNGYITVERALQRFFLFHWQEHLETLRVSEGE